MRNSIQVLDVILYGSSFAKYSKEENSNNMFMKKFSAVVVFALLLVAESAMAQIEINAYGGYMPGSHTMYSYNGYRLKIDGGGNFGVGVGMATPLGVVAELSYMRFSSTLRQDGAITDVETPQPINEDN